MATSLSLPLAAQQQSNHAIEKDTYVSGELTRTIDVAKVRVGDTVTVRLVNGLAVHGKIYTSGKILGHIKEIQQSAPDNPKTRLVIVLDHIQLKGRAEEPVVAVIGLIERPATPVINRVSGVPSTGNPVARAAGTMGESGGRPVRPLPTPTPREEPMPTRVSADEPSDLKEIQVTPNYEAHETVITGGKKLRLLKEFQINVILYGSDSNNPIK